MRLLKNNRGQIRVIEAFFASMLLLSVISLVPLFQKDITNSNEVLPTSPENVLINMDSNGHLSDLIMNKNWVELKNCIQFSLPLMVWFNLTVFDENMNQINEIPIGSGTPVSDHIVVFDYISASTNRVYSIYIIRIQLSGVD